MQREPESKKEIVTDISALAIATALARAGGTGLSKPGVGEGNMHGTCVDFVTP